MDVWTLAEQANAGGGGGDGGAGCSCPDGEMQRRGGGEASGDEEQTKEGVLRTIKTERQGCEETKHRSNTQCLSIGDRGYPVL